MWVPAFCFLWAAAELFDLLCFPDWIHEPAGIGLFLAALAVLLKPSSRGRFLALCVLDVAYLWVKSPETSNHVLFKGLACLSIIVVALRHGRQGPDAAPRAAAEAAAILRLELCALYFISFLHKLNWDFLEPSTSCAGFMLDGLADRLPFVPTGPVADVAAVWSTLLIEGGVPVLLLIPRTRHLGLIVAGLFHFLLSFHPYPGIFPFSAMVYALLSLFLPLGFYERLDAQIACRPRLETFRQRLLGGGLRWSPLLTGMVAMAVVIGSFCGGVSLRGTNMQEWPPRVGMLIWIPYAMVILAGLLVGWPATPASTPDRPHGGIFQHAFRSPALVIFALVVLNGIAPYLGFQTVRVLSMFSNLRTEGGVSNHLFIPVGWQRADYQTDLVEIVSSSEQGLQSYGDARRWIPFAEVRRRIWRPQPPARVTFVRNARTYSVDTGEREAPEQVPPLGFWARRILAFRGISMEKSAECQW